MYVNAQSSGLQGCGCNACGQSLGAVLDDAQPVAAPSDDQKRELLNDFTLVVSVLSLIFAMTRK